MLNDFWVIFLALHDCIHTQLVLYQGCVSFLQRKLKTLRVEPSGSLNSFTNQSSIAQNCSELQFVFNF